MRVAEVVDKRRAAIGRLFLRLVASAFRRKIRATLPCFRLRRKRISGQQLLQRDDVRLVDGLDGALGPRVVGAKRLDRVADELQADRLPRARGIEVHHAAADGELAGLVGRVLPRVAGVRQPIAEIDRGDVIAGAQSESGGLEPGGRAQARQERRGGRDHQPRGARAQRMKGAGARRRDVEVRRQAAIGIDLVRRERHHEVRGVGVRHAFEGRQEEPRVRGELLHVRVGRGDEHDAVAGPAAAAANSAFAAGVSPLTPARAHRDRAGRRPS